MKLKDRVTIISEENYSRLSSLYGELDIEDLQRIVNRHIAVAIEEIREDMDLSKRVPHCEGCEYVKCIDYVYKNYYCDNEDRTDDMGKLGVDNPPKTSPKWCPKRKIK